MNSFDSKYKTQNILSILDEKILNPSNENINEIMAYKHEQTKFVTEYVNEELLKKDYNEAVDEAHRKYISKSKRFFDDFENQLEALQKELNNKTKCIIDKSSEEFFRETSSKVDFVDKKKDQKNFNLVCFRLFLDLMKGEKIEKNRIFKS